MIVAIHQPNYWPWYGLLDKINKVDLFIILDDVPANKSSYQYRNKFYCNGESKWITLPVDYKMGKKINELKFKNFDWINQHLQKLKEYYKVANHFDDFYEDLLNLYSTGDDSLYAIDFIVRTMKYTFKIMDIDTNIKFSSEISTNSHKGDMVLDLCVQSKATSYLSGNGAKSYFTEDQLNNFKNYKIDLDWQKFEHPVYQQNSQYSFVSGLSILDCLFWQGKEKSRDLLKKLK